MKALDGREVRVRAGLEGDKQRANVANDRDRGDSTSEILYWTEKTVPGSFSEQTTNESNTPTDLPNCCTLLMMMWICTLVIVERCQDDADWGVVAN